MIRTPRRTRRIGFSFGLILAGLGTWSACSSTPPPAPAPAVTRTVDSTAPVATTVRIVILHTNDVHGQLLPLGTRNGPRGGYPSLVSRLRKERDEAKASGATVFTFDGGDIYTGTPEGDMTDGRLVMDLMNLVGFDAWEIGNHEFDHGVETVKSLALQAKCPVLAGNLIDETTKKRPEWARASVHLRAGDLDVCVIGLITSGLKHVTTKKGSAGVDVEKEEVVVERELALEENKSAKVKLLLTHCGVDVDERLAKKFHDRLTAIVGGHSHTPIFEPKREGGDGPFVVQAGSRGQWVGRAELVVARDTGKLLEAKGKLIEIDPKTETEAEDVKKALDEGSREVSRIMDVKVGELKAPLTRQSSRENASSALGNLLCDMMRDHAKADLAFHNKTGIRADMDFTGEVKLRHLHQVSPFGNTVVCVTLTGEQVKELCEHMLGRGRPMLEVSGGVIRYDSSKKRGERLVDVTIGGKALDPKGTYRVATNSFLAEGGDGLKVFTQGTDRQDDGSTMLEISRRWFEGKTIEVPPVEHRLVDASKEAPKDE